MAGMAPYKPTPKADEYKPGDVVAWSQNDTGTLSGQLWSRAENPVRVEARGYWQSEIRHQGKFWFAVTEDGSAFTVNERDMSHVLAREEVGALI